MEKKVYLKDENVLTLISLNNLIVPEIQREYVWGTYDNGEKLKSFLESLKKQIVKCDSCHRVHLKSGKQSVNVGFLYSYKPPYVTIEHERFLDEYLIDGQQRLTSIFLLLCWLAVKENRRSDFCTLCRFEQDDTENVCFSYRVRDLTQMFVIKLLTHIENGGCLDFDKKKPNWLLDDFENDATVKSMIAALKIIRKNFCDDALYYDYILQSVHFWHFKTEATSQGEELYITMNSRGEKLESYETIKASLLTPSALKNWGPKWEEWTDFFWKNRGQNEDADSGMDAFLDCIQEMIRYHNVLYNITEDQLLNNERVEFFFNALRYVCGERKVNGDNIYDKFNNTMNTYPQDWLTHYVDDVKKQIPYYSYKTEKKSNWYIDPDKEENYYNVMQNAYLVWSWMYYLDWRKQKKGYNNFDDLLSSFNDEDFRVLFKLMHLFQIRKRSNKHNTKQMMKLIKVLADDQGQNGFDLCTILNGQEKDLLDEEEIFISSLLQNNKGNIIRIEPEIWKLQKRENMRIESEDHIGHTLSILKILDKGMLNGSNNIYEYFKTMNESLDYFEESRNLNIIKSILLFYNEDGPRNLVVGKTMAADHSFWYCKNDFNWESRYITNSGRYMYHRAVFGNLLNEYVQYVMNYRKSNSSQHSVKDIKSLDKILCEKRDGFFSGNIVLSDLSVSKQLIIYDYFLKIWDNCLPNIVIKPTKNNSGIVANYDVFCINSRLSENQQPLALSSNWKSNLMNFFPVLIQ